MLVTLVAAWGLLEVSKDARRTRWVCSQQEPLNASNYRAGGPTWRRLEDFTKRVEATVPPGEVIAFRAGPGQIAIPRYASFLLPRHEVIVVASHKVPDEARFMASFGSPWRRGDLVPLAHHPDGWIYRRP